jgi:hypothetical protein
MITNRNNSLKLRKHSIRTLTRSELNVVHGGGSGTRQDWVTQQTQQTQQAQQGGY